MRQSLEAYFKIFTEGSRHFLEAFFKIFTEGFRHSSKSTAGGCGRSVLHLRWRRECADSAEELAITIVVCLGCLDKAHIQANAKKTVCGVLQ